MNKKGIELAISTLIIIILGVVLLIAIILAVTGGFDRFKSATDPLLETTGNAAIKIACNLACENVDRLSFCCGEEDAILCDDLRLEIDCPKIDCTGYECNPTDREYNDCELTNTMIVVDGATKEVRGQLIEGNTCPDNMAKVSLPINIEPGKVCCFLNN